MDINDFHGLKEVIVSGIANKVHDDQDNYILFSTKDSGENNKFLATDLSNGLFSLSLVDGFKVKTNKTFNMYDRGGHVFGGIQSFIRDSLKVNGSVASRQSVIDRSVKEQIKVIFADLFQKLAGKYDVGYNGDFIRVLNQGFAETEIHCWDGKIVVNCKFNGDCEGYNKSFDVSQKNEVIDVVLGFFTNNKTREQFNCAVIQNVKNNSHSDVYYTNKETRRTVCACLEYEGFLSISIISNGKCDGHFVIEDLSGENISAFCDAACKIVERFKKVV